MSLEQYLVENSSHANICFDCEKACGGCPWTEVDDKTGHIRFEPIPGWTAKASSIKRVYCENKKRITVEVPTYHITACPLFERTPDRNSYLWEEMA